MPRSGLRFGLPNALVRSADAELEPSVTTLIEYVRDAANGDGALPAAPHAPRSFTLFACSLSKNDLNVGSSETMYETCAFG